MEHSQRQAMALRRNLTIANFSRFALASVMPQATALLAVRTERNTTHTALSSGIRLIRFLSR